MTRWLLLAIALLALAGCGGGGSTLTGGSVPTGNIDGTLYTTPNARVTGYAPVGGVVVTATDAAGKTLQRTTTGIDGAFLLTNVPLVALFLQADDGPHGKHARVAVTTDAITRHTHVELVLAPPPGPDVDGMLLSPTNAQVKVGDQVQFTARSLTGNHQPGDAAPVSWAVKGDIGAIDADGIFTATNPGVGRVVAQFGDTQVTAIVAVAGAAGAAHGK